MLQDYIDAVAAAGARVGRLPGQIAALLPGWSLAPVVDAVQAMRGVGFIVAVTVVAGVGDFTRFAGPRQRMACLGLTPSEQSSGASLRRGGTPKAGRGLARRVLIGGAWSCRRQARVSPKLLARLEALPQAVRDIAWKGQLRMCQRYRHLVAAGKAEAVATTAITPEMAGFLRAIARAVTAPPAEQSLCQSEKRARTRISPMRRVGGGTRRGPLVACSGPAVSAPDLQSAAAPGRNHGHAVPDPRRRACSTAVSGPSPALRIPITRHPAPPGQVP